MINRCSADCTKSNDRCSFFSRNADTSLPLLPKSKGLQACGSVASRISSCATVTSVAREVMAHRPIHVSFVEPLLYHLHIGKSLLDGLFRVLELGASGLSRESVLGELLKYSTRPRARLQLAPLKDVLKAKPTLLIPNGDQAHLV